MLITFACINHAFYIARFILKVISDTLIDNWPNFTARGYSYV